MMLCLMARGASADIAEARREFHTGNYDRCLALCLEVASPGRFASEDWQLLLAECQSMVGQYAEAYQTITNAVDRRSYSVRTRWIGYNILRQNGYPEEADLWLTEILALANTSPANYRDSASLVAIGQAAIRRGADPKQILEKLFDQAKRRDPEYRGTYLAAGELALNKNDYALAAKQYREGLKKFPDDPDFYFGLARSYTTSDAAEVNTNINTTLKLNPNHLGAMLLLVDHLIDSEEYTEADKLLDRALKINPWLPEAWASRAVLSALRNDSAGYVESRDKALKFWKTNPSVDWQIGQKLSRKYRFAEGAKAQRQALNFASDFLPSKIQLAQDLLRLGHETDGWNLAEDVFQRDSYDVVAYNLVTLKDAMVKFATVTNQDFIVRMGKKEADIYGDRVLALLDRAKTTLGAKYGIAIQTPVTVEIFPEAKDFAVRTFGLPGESGYLGVCFGNVITANSPARPTASPANWESMLWHEFTHVITLQMTANKIPRWLSEGISVYEERQVSPSWGQRQDVHMHEALLGGKLRPMTHLSAAFLTAKESSDLMFAYYESSLAVEFLMQRYGLDAMKKILADLNEGVELNKALAEHTAAIPELEEAFGKYALEHAKSFGPELEWDKLPKDLVMEETDGTSTNLAQEIRAGNLQVPNFLGGSKTTLSKWVQDHPKNYWGLKALAHQRMNAKKWAEAKEPLEKLVELVPGDISGGGSYPSLAYAHRQLNETNREEAVLAKWALLDDTATDAYGRLMQLASTRQDWTNALENANRYLAVQPVAPPAYRIIAQANEALNQPKPAIHAYRLLLQLDPPDPADTHFRLARLLHQENEPDAKRQVLQALEEAPRFREAHRLLRAIKPAPEPPVELEPAKVEIETVAPAPAPAPSPSETNSPPGQ